MAQPKVFFVHLRRPNRSNPKERRDDPFYEFGSFGCTKCHSRNLFHPRNASKLEGARLAFVQGGKQGSRLVFLTPPITVTVWKNNCEARWMPPKMPFKYAHAPLLVRNDGGRSDFPSVRKFASRTRWGRTKVERGLSSRIRSLAEPLPPELACEVIETYERLRKEARRSAFAATYDEALPWPPPMPDRKREKTYQEFLSSLSRDANGTGKVLHTEVPPPRTGLHACCGVSRCRSRRPAATTRRA
ncbi:MAG: hypothetical protein ABR915_03200 [Thermoguttaceae bacterium]|jgi:hypothetical protein